MKDPTKCAWIAIGPTAEKEASSTSFPNVHPRPQESTPQSLRRSHKSQQSRPRTPNPPPPPPPPPPEAAQRHHHKRTVTMHVTVKKKHQPCHWLTTSSPRGSGDGLFCDHPRAAITPGPQSPLHSSDQASLAAARTTPPQTSMPMSQ